MKTWQGKYDIDDVWEIVHRPENDAKRFELIDGELVEFPVAGFQHIEQGLKRLFKSLQ